MKQKYSLLVMIMVLAMLWMGHTTAKNFIFDSSFYEFINKKDVTLRNVTIWRAVMRVHIFLAIVALVTGLFGILKVIQTSASNFHRWNGRIYVIAILLNYVPGVYLSFFATGGLISVIGFLILNTLWSGTAILGYVSIRKRKVVQHKQWMIRSFFLCFANTTIYIVVAIVHYGFKVPYSESYQVAVWLSWILNLRIAEIVIRKNILT